MNYHAQNKQLINKPVFHLKKKKTQTNCPGPE